MYALYCRLNVTIHESDRAVVRALWPRLDPDKRRDPSLRAARRSLYRDVLKEHHKARAFARRFSL